MRAALIRARELLQCGLAESGRDALLERVAELLDAAASGAPPFCIQLPPQIQDRSHGGIMRAHAISGRPQGWSSTNTSASAGG